MSPQETENMVRQDVSNRLFDGQNNMFFYLYIVIFDYNWYHRCLDPDPAESERFKALV
jgi:hypothetical protein